MISLRLLAGVTLLAIVSTPPTVGAQNIDKVSPVTQERLIKPEPENWLMYRGSYDGFGYSALDKINTRNVKISYRYGAFPPAAGRPSIAPHRQ